MFNVNWKGYLKNPEVRLIERNITVSSFSRSIEGQGQHRMYRDEIKFTGKAEKCQLKIADTVRSNIYYDIDELRRGEVVSSKQSTNLIGLLDSRNNRRRAT